MNITPEQALTNLTQIAEVALLNGVDRRVVNESIHVLAALIATAKATPAAAPKE